MGSIKKGMVTGLRSFCKKHAIKTPGSSPVTSGSTATRISQAHQPQLLVKYKLFSTSAIWGQEQEASDTEMATYGAEEIISDCAVNTHRADAR